MRWEYVGEISRNVFIVYIKNVYMRNLKIFFQFRNIMSQVFFYIFLQYLVIIIVVQRVLKKKWIRSKFFGVRQVMVCIYSVIKLENCLYMFMSFYFEGVFNQRLNDYYFQFESQLVYWFGQVNCCNK